MKKLVKIFELNWVCKCGNTLSDDRNFCPQCDREKPFGH